VKSEQIAAVIARRNGKIPHLPLRTGSHIILHKSCSFLQNGFSQTVWIFISLISLFFTLFALLYLICSFLSAFLNTISLKINISSQERRYVSMVRQAPAVDSSKNLKSTDKEFNGSLFFIPISFSTFPPAKSPASLIWSRDIACRFSESLASRETRRMSLFFSFLSFSLSTSCV